MMPTATCRKLATDIRKLLNDGRTDYEDIINMVLSNIDEYSRVRSRALADRPETGIPTRFYALRTLVLAKVQEATSVEPALILSDHRSKMIAKPRHVACAVLWRCGLGITYTTIGKLLNRDHASVMHAIRSIERDPEWLPVVEEVFAAVKQHKLLEAA